MDKISLSTDPAKLNVDFIHNFLKSSYWAKGRTKRQVEKTIEHSLCYGIFLADQQIGFARVASDQTIFAYLMDVFIIEEYRSRGYAKVLLEYVFSDPRLANVEKWMLATNDASGLYSKFEFAALAKPELFMEKIRKKHD